VRRVPAARMPAAIPARRVSKRVSSACTAHAQRVPSACLARAPGMADESDPTVHAEALACLKEKCPGIGKAKATAHVLAAH